MEDITNDASFFKGKSIKIEERIAGGRVDLMIVDDIEGNHTWIEYKWYGGQNGLSKDFFINQFVGRDLSGISNLQKLQWRLKGQKITKDMIVNANGTGWLQLPQGVNQLKKISAAQANKLLGRTDLKDLFDADRQIIADKFIEYFSNSNNFNTIFK